MQADCRDQLMLSIIFPVSTFSVPEPGLQLQPIMRVAQRIYEKHGGVICSQQ
jgi:hypothetical protein